MEVHVLASGSTGNSTFIKCGTQKFLVDAGISARRIKLALESLGYNIEDIDGIFITHEHTDHVKGLVTLTKKYKLPIFARPKTWSNMKNRESISQSSQKEIVNSLLIGDIKVETFNISHDAIDPVGFNFFYQDIKCTVATDLGFVTDTVKEALDNSDIIVFESNHDPDMLEKGAYPWHLKKRIMSNRGHLSNIDAAWTLARLNRKAKTHVFLAHLSQENNLPYLAEQTIKDILEKQGICTVNEISLQLTYPNQIASMAK